MQQGGGRKKLCSCSNTMYLMTYFVYLYYVSKNITGVRRTNWNVKDKRFLHSRLRGDSIITWVYTFFMILCDGKLRGGWHLIEVRDAPVKKIQWSIFV